MEANHSGQPKFKAIGSHWVKLLTIASVQIWGQRSKFLTTTFHNEQISIRNGFLRLYLSPMLRKKKSLLYTKWKWKLLSHVHSLRPHGLHSPWNFPGPSTGVGSLCLLQGIFPTQGYNPGLLPCRQILYQLSHQVSQFWPFLKKIGIFLVWTTFKVFYWIYYNIVSFLCFGFLAVRHVGS